MKITPSLYEVARSIGCKISKWEPDENRGWKFDVQQLKGQLQDNTKLVVANFPHNPTGYLPSSEDFKALINLVRQRQHYCIAESTSK